MFSRVSCSSCCPSILFLFVVFSVHGSIFTFPCFDKIGLMVYTPIVYIIAESTKDGCYGGN